jgi:multidrug resistance efflux pump
VKISIRHPSLSWQHEAWYYATLSGGQTDNPGGPLLNGVALEYAREPVATLEIALDAAKQGVFLGDGYNDASWSEQRRSDLLAQGANYASALKEAQAKFAAVVARVQAERLRVNRFSEVSLKAPVNGLFWEFVASNGEDIQRGDAVLKMVDCSSALVTLSVTENIYNSLSVGDAARFKPNGDNRTFDGTVARLAGTGAQSIYMILAVAPSQRHLERFDVALTVPALRADPALACAIGRTGRVFFQDRPLDWFRSRGGRCLGLL